jgi:hypothetical protein
MPDIDLKKVSVVTAATATMASNATASGEQAKVAELAAKLADSDIGVARAARRELWEIVRHVGRPDAQTDKLAVVTELEMLLKEGQPAAVYREVLWMLSEIGTSDSVKAVAPLLSNKTAREDARMALERIPGEESMAALKSALDVAPDNFKANLAQSLRARGTQVPGLPCEKLKPTKRTNVKVRSEAVS